MASGVNGRGPVFVIHRGNVVPQKHSMFLSKLFKIYAGCCQRIINVIAYSTERVCIIIDGQREVTQIAKQSYEQMYMPWRLLSLIPTTANEGQD
jgi:hypothetical protein